MEENFRRINNLEPQLNLNQLVNIDNNTRRNPFKNFESVKESNRMNIQYNNNNMNNMNNINNMNNMNNPEYISNPFRIHNQNQNQNNINIIGQNSQNINYINNNINNLNSLNILNNNNDFHLIRCGKKFNNNDINLIINSSYEELNRKGDPLSKSIIQRIKNLLGGNWVVFICVVGLKGYDLSVSVDDEDRLISFIIKNFKFQIIKISD